MVAPSPNTATAPSGSGWVMMPTMVARNMASKCQAWAVTPAIRFAGQTWLEEDHIIDQMQRTGNDRVRSRLVVINRKMLERVIRFGRQYKRCWV